ncbi:50S ribosomal protein L21e [Candidatus Burarchaeum australiense]|nr:50S ribosomal protein L21e [Candidatus Burarchaeum australiense]
MKRSLGRLSKRSRLLRKRSRTTLTVSRKLKVLNVGDRVHITQASSRSMPHPRYRGKTGMIIGLRGSSYLVEVADHNMVKRLVIDGVDLTKVM